jgi:hypothetical protein
MAQTDRNDLESAPARGIVNEPTIGTRIVRRAMVSAFMVRIYFLNRSVSIVSPPGIVKVFHKPSSGYEQGFSEEINIAFSPGI